MFLECSIKASQQLSNEEDIRSKKNVTREPPDNNNPQRKSKPSLTYSISISVVISMSSLKTVAAALVKSVENVDETNAPLVTHPLANAVAAVLACAKTLASCVVLVSNVLILTESCCWIKGVNPETFAANLLSATILPM